MPLILIYGNGSSAVLNRKAQIKKEFDKNSIKEISAKEMSFERALIDIKSGGLFAGKRLFILEDFDDSIDLSKIDTVSEDTVVVTISKNLTPASKLLKIAQSSRFQIINLTEKEEVSVFPFLDKLAENKQKAFEDFEALFKEYGSQYLLTMIIFMMRRFVIPARNLPPFILKKIELQKKSFPIEKIKKIYFEVIEADFKIKRGLVDERTALTILINNILTN